MKIKNSSALKTLFAKSVCSAVAICFLSAQSYAIDQSLDAIRMIAATQDPNSPEALEQMNDAIDQVVQNQGPDDEIAKAASDDKKDAADESLDFSKRQKRIEARWVGKLQKRRDKIVQKFASATQAATDDRVNQIIDSVMEKSTHNGDPDTMSRFDAIRTESPAQKKLDLIDMEKTGFDRSIPKMAETIAQEGGLIPFLLHAKAAIRQLKNINRNEVAASVHKQIESAFALNKKQLDRAPASIDAVWAVVGGILAILLVIAVGYWIVLFCIAVF